MTMKKISTVLVLIILHYLPAYSQADSAAAKVKTGEKAITGSFEMNYLRHYIWRGIAFGNDDVAQPVLALSHKIP